MNKILEYKLENVDQQTIKIPLPARIVSVMERDYNIVLCAVVDDDEGIPKIPIDILVVGTGDFLENNIGLYTPLGTVKLFEGEEVWHVLYRYADHKRDRNSEVREPTLIEEFKRESPGGGGIMMA